MSSQVRTYDVDNHLFDLLNVAAMNTVLEGESRVIKSNFGITIDAPKGQYWNRLVLMPRVSNFSPRQYDDSNRKYSFMVRVDSYPPNDNSFDVKRKLEAIHDVAFDLLQNQIITGMNNAVAFYSIRRERYPTPPVMDSAGFYYSSANYFVMLRGV